jgi:hypothetical protein
MITIYVVIHNTFENTNVFFTKKEDAIHYINTIIPTKYPDEPKEVWSIREIIEGEEFVGVMAFY